MNKALGLIETYGLPTAIEAADAAVKAANVTLLGYEKTRGMGMIVVKFVGEVGAVNAAVSAGAAAALRVGKVAACHVIARPHDDLEKLISKLDRGQVAPPEGEPEPPKKPAPPKRKPPRQPKPKPQPPEMSEPPQPPPPPEPSKVEPPPVEIVPDETKPGEGEASGPAE